MTTKSHRFWLAAALAATLAGPAHVGRAELESWDPARVTELSGQLAEAIGALRDAERREIRPPVDPHQRSRLEYLDTLKALDASAKQLSTRLQAGANRDETLPIARKIRVLVRDAEENGKKFMETEQVTARITPAYEALESLAPYYFDEPRSRDPMAQRKLEGASQQRAPAAE